MFQALIAHPQEGYTSDSWYNACVIYQLTAPGLKKKEFLFNTGVVN
jgi:hypothetical protein